MAETKTFSMAEVAAHAEKDNIYLVVHDKVYDCSKFVEEHPGGEEVMLDVGGQDATEAFEDVGHSDEARALLKDMLVGDLKREPGELPKKSYAQAHGSSGANGGSSGGVGAGAGSMVVYVLVAVGAGLAFYLYNMMQQQQKTAGAA